MPSLLKLSRGAVTAEQHNMYITVSADLLFQTAAESAVLLCHSNCRAGILKKRCQGPVSMGVCLLPQQAGTALLAESRVGFGMVAVMVGPASTCTDV